MNCNLIDISCQITRYLDPAFVWWANAIEFVQFWFPLATFIAGLVLGAYMGKKVVAAVLTLGIATLIWRAAAHEPDYETGEPPQNKQAKNGRN